LRDESELGPVRHPRSTGQQKGEPDASVASLRSVRPLEGNSYPFFAGGAVAVWRPVPPS